MDTKEAVYLFKVSLNLNRKKIYREMSLKGSSSLAEFAETIVNAFDFQLDHAFGFYNNIKNFYKSNEVYTSFKDAGMRSEVGMPKEKGCRNTQIYKVFEPSKKMHFHFDYGDDWAFIVECRGITEVEVGEVYPKVTKKHGEAPPQYPSDSDEE